jgi:hypothetical protein
MPTDSLKNTLEYQFSGGHNHSTFRRCCTNGYTSIGNVEEFVWEEVKTNFTNFLRSRNVELVVPVQVKSYRNEGRTGYHDSIDRLLVVVEDSSTAGKVPARFAGAEIVCLYKNDDLEYSSRVYHADDFSSVAPLPAIHVDYLSLMSTGNTSPSVEDDRLHGGAEGTLLDSHRDYEVRIERALDLISSYGGIDGAHHKAWVLDQVVRELTRGGYPSWLIQQTKGEDGPDTYEWDEGIAP